MKEIYVSDLKGRKIVIVSASERHYAGAPIGKSTDADVLEFIQGFDVGSHGLIQFRKVTLKGSSELLAVHRFKDSVLAVGFRENEYCACVMLELLNGQFTLHNGVPTFFMQGVAAAIMHRVATRPVYQEQLRQLFCAKAGARQSGKGEAWRATHAELERAFGS